MIEQHNKAAIEIHKINLIIRKSLASLFINFSIIKIISLYLLVSFNEILIKFYLAQVILLPIICGFGLTYLFTLQIKSAHQPIKTFHSIVCNYKMDLKLKLKVS